MRSEQISTILDDIDAGRMALPEFQRGYVWNSEQVRALFDSLYHKHPIGSLLVWKTEDGTAEHRGEYSLASGTISLLLDGQQRMTTLYGVIRGKAPEFFDGNDSTFAGLHFHLEEQAFSFYQYTRMKDDPLWIDVSELMKAGNDGVGSFIAALAEEDSYRESIAKYLGRLNQLLAISDKELHIEEVSGQNKSIEVVVDIFNRVNSKGTTLSSGDLALAKICSVWSNARNSIKSKLKDWEKAGFYFKKDWFLRSINTVLTGEAKFHFLHEKTESEVMDGFRRASKQIDTCLNLISGRLGLDHDRVLFGRNAIPVMAHFLDRQGGNLTENDRDKLLFWYVHAGMWGRFSGSTEALIDQDLGILQTEHGNLDDLIEQLRLAHGGLHVEPGHFTGWSLGDRFYPVLYLITRLGEARDWGSGLPLKHTLVGSMNRLEVHHIFPKSQLYKRGLERADVNAIANFCLLTKDTNLAISNRLPEEYFVEIESKQPGALESQWIPNDKELWKIQNYHEFLAARKKLLANEVNSRLAELLHEDPHWIDLRPPAYTVQKILGGTTNEEEEAQLRSLNEWVTQRGLAAGILAFDLADNETGQQLAIFDLAWPIGLQEGLSKPVAVLLNESSSLMAVASRAGYRVFDSISTFHSYVESEVLRRDVAA